MKAIAALAAKETNTTKNLEEPTQVNGGERWERGWHNASILFWPKEVGDTDNDDRHGEYTPENFFTAMRRVRGLMHRKLGKVLLQGRVCDRACASIGS